MLGIIIQARVGSTRLPNKMALPFYNNQGVLEVILRKIKNGVPNLPLVVATTINKQDDKIVEICKINNVDFFRGSEENVLERFVEAANEYKFTKIIRICADNPFIDIPSLQILIEKYKGKNLDYISFKTSEDKPTIITHYGFWAEGVSLKALQEVRTCTENPLYLEHVTNFIHSNPKNFNIELIPIPVEIEKVEGLRMTMDTQEDYILLKEIYKECIELGIIDIKDIVKFINKNKEWLLQMEEQIKVNTK